MSKISIDTHRSGRFYFEVGVDFEQIKPILQRVADAQARFASVPILPDIATQLEREVLVASVFGTNTIEGGTLTEAETAQVIASESAPGENEQRVLNIRNAYAKAEQFAEHILTSNGQSQAAAAVQLEELMLTDLHAIITQGLSHPHNIPGQFRDNEKGQLTKVGDVEHGGVYTPPKCRDDIELLLTEFLNWINSESLLSLNPLIRAPLAHYYFERIHPFWDGNGRVGRVLEAVILKCAGFKYAPFALSRFYLQHIDDYFSVFNIARKKQEDHDKHPNTVFVELFLHGMLHVLNELHNRVNRIMAFILYENALNNLVNTRQINSRQYSIVHTLLQKGQTHAIKDIQSQTWYTLLYRKLSAKTRTRDLKQLVELGLISVNKEHITLLIP